MITMFTYIKLLSSTNVINMYLYVIKYLYNQEYFFIIKVQIYLQIIIYILTTI